MDILSLRLVSLDLRLSDEVLDAIEGAYDLIIRNARLAAASLHESYMKSENICTQ